jgi:predicted dienelactone hydrolase
MAASRPRPARRLGRRDNLRTGLGILLGTVLLVPVVGPAGRPAYAAALGSSQPASMAPRSSASDPAAPIRLTLPEPTGRHAVGRTELHLVDQDRPDPWLADGRPRELMVSVWYPARPRGEPAAPYMTPGAAAEFDRGASAILGIEPGRADWAGIQTYAHAGATADTRHGRRPVLLYSPGFWNERTVGSALPVELASQGYVVVTVDHTYEAHAVEFPDGRVATPLIPQTDPVGRMRAALPVRVADIRFVLDQLGVLARGGNPDAGRRALPDGLGRLLDLSRVGAFGHSAGGLTAAQAMYEDRRIDAGVNLDGPLGYDWTSPDQLAPVARHGLDRPLLLMGARLPDASPHTHRTSPSWASYWRHATGPKVDLWLPDAGHNTFTDYPALLPVLAERVTLPDGLLEGLIGTVGPARSLAAQRAYLVAFFDRYLLDRRSALLDRPSPRFPEVTFVQ